MASEERPLRLLSLDGGGVRGLSTIYIVQDIMRRVNLGRSEDELLEPWQYFDMIGGTSTGGIIAIMLGCLKMSLEECEKAYIDLSKELFTPRRSSSNWMGRGVDIVNANGKFDAKVLEDAIKKIIGSRTTSSEVELLSDPEPECKVFVCAIQSSQHDTTPVLLRTYRNDAVADLMSKKFKLWEACRATSAASTFFDPLVIHNGPISSYFLDGGLVLNNPVDTVFKEAQQVWGRERRMSLISVGTGDAPSGQFHGNLKNVVEGLAKIATDSRIAAERFHSSQQGQPQVAGNYFRLNVSGMGTIGLEEHKLCGEIEHATQYYLQSGETLEKLEKCVRALLETEQQENKPRRLSASDMEKIKEFARHLYQRSFNYGDIDRVPLRSGNTCEWFLKLPNFVQWQQSPEPSALWVTADAGCGKSVLARFLISQLLSDNHMVIHFFFHHFRYEKNSLLCALLHQLLTLFIPSARFTPSTMLHMLRDELEYKKGEQVMHNDETLWKIICNATTGTDLTSSKLFCVIDGLDECPKKSRSQFIELVISAFSSSGTARQPHRPPSFLITSRPYAEIEDHFRPLSRIRLRLENETSAISKDIETMITDRLQNLNPMRFPSKTQEYLHTEISRKAGRTFLWVKLIFDSLEQLDSTTREELRKVLGTNPNELNSLYESSLSGTKNSDKTRRLLQILIAATKPLKLYEVNVALQIRETCVCYADIDLEPDIQGTIKRLCGSVIRVIGSTVDFMHQTAREFLITHQYPPRECENPSSREPTAFQSIPQKSQDLTWRESIHVAQSHCVLGSICLRYLALSDLEEFAQYQIQRSKLKSRGCRRTQKFVKRSNHYSHLPDGGLMAVTNLFRSLNTRSNHTEIPADFQNYFRFYRYAAQNWPYHSEEALREDYEVGFKQDPDFLELQDFLTSLRMSGLRKIRRSIGIQPEHDPFAFLEDWGFHAVVQRLLNGPRIHGYKDSQLLEAVCQLQQDHKDIFTWPLFQYATAALGDSKNYSTEETNKMFSRIANVAARICSISTIEYLQEKAEITLNQADLDRGLERAAKSPGCTAVAKLIGWGAKASSAQVLLDAFTNPSPNRETLFLLRAAGYLEGHIIDDHGSLTMFIRYRADQEGIGPEQMEVFKSFLQFLLDLPLEFYLRNLAQAIRLRHPSVAFLIQSRMDLAHSYELEQKQKGHRGIDDKLRALFSIACRYGSPAPYLLFDHAYPNLDVNEEDEFGITPLIAAILANDYHLCEWLLQKKANVNVYVSFKGLYRSFSGFITKEYVPIPPRDWKWNDCYPKVPELGNRYGAESFHGCPLTEAIRMRTFQTFKLLLEYGADPWQNYEAEVSVLMVAASYSEDCFNQVVGLIWANESDSFKIDRPETNSGRTFLHIAAKNGFWNSVIKLISHGSTLNIGDTKGNTPLHEAASFPPTTGRVKTFKRLVEDHNADANKTNNAGKTPLDLLQESVSNCPPQRRDQDHFQTWNFLRKLRSESGYLPSIRRDAIRKSEVSLGKRKRSASSSSSELDVDWTNLSDNSDLGSESDSGVSQDAMHDMHPNLDAKDSAERTSEGTSVQKERKGTFRFLVRIFIFLCTVHRLACFL